MQARASTLLHEFSFVEFRLDFLPHPLDALHELSSFIAAAPGATFLATCRPARSGGQFGSSAQDELGVLLAAGKAGFTVCDLSLESAEELGADALAQLRATGASVLLSFHDFRSTGDLEGVLGRMRLFRPDLCKIVPTAQSLTDSLAVLNFLRDHRTSSQPLIALAMGEHGVLTRILGPLSGSAFTFAAATEAEATAPGQLTARSLADLYRIRTAGAATRIFGVAGDPVRSSMSPLMLGTAFAQAGLDAVYLPLRTGSAHELLEVARKLPLAGFSVTMPLKQAILPLLDAVDPLAARIGAVNTVWRTPDGRFHGSNTDVSGIASPLVQRLSLRGARVLVIGTGGAARAAVFACADRGAAVYITNRTPESATRLAKEAGAIAIPGEAIATEQFDILINATPAGMRGNALRLPIREDELRANLVFDLVYNPLETPLIALARAKGLEVIPGVEMFVHQGARQFELWTGLKAPVSHMHSAVLDRLESL